MKKHAKLEHSALFKRYVEKVNNCPKASSVHEPTIKSLHATPSANSIFFLLLTNSKEKNYETHVALSKDVMLYVIEGSLQWRWLNGHMIAPKAYKWNPRVVFLSKKNCF